FGRAEVPADSDGGSLQHIDGGRSRLFGDRLLFRAQLKQTAHHASDRSAVGGNFALHDHSIQVDGYEKNIGPHASPKNRLLTAIGIEFTAVNFLLVPRSRVAEKLRAFLGPLTEPVFQILH